MGLARYGCDRASPLRPSEVSVRHVSSLIDVDRLDLSNCIRGRGACIDGTRSFHGSQSCCRVAATGATTVGNSIASS